MNSQVNKDRINKSPNSKSRPIGHNIGNNNNERIIKVSSISNLDTEKISQQKLNKNKHLQSTLPANVEKSYINDGLRNFGSDKKKPQIRNKSEKSDKILNEAGQSPPIQNRAMFFNQRNQDYEQQLQQQSIENSKISSLQKITLPKNFVLKDQHQKLESIIQNQRNIFFQPITNNGNNNQNSNKKLQNKPEFNQYPQNSTQKKINIKENYPQDLITSLQQNSENSNIMSINDYADQAFLQNQKKAVVFTDHIIQGIKQQGNLSISNQSPPQPGRKYFTPKLATMRKDSNDYGNEKNTSPNIFTKQQQNQVLNQNQMHKSSSTKNTTQSTSSPTTQKGVRLASNQQNTLNQKSLLSPNKEQMKQKNPFNQINTQGNYLDSSNNLQETLFENESQTQFYNSSSYTTKLPEISSSSALSTRPKGNNQNGMDVFQQKNNKQNNQYLNQDQSKQNQPNQFQLQQQYSSRKNSNKGIQQQSVMNASVFTNSSCIQLTNSSQINQSQNKNSQQIEESKKSQSLARGDQGHQLAKNIQQKQNDYRDTGDASISSLSPKPTMRKSLVQNEQISSSRKQIEDNQSLKKSQRNPSNIESVKKQNNKSFQFEEYKKTGKSQKNIEDDQVKQKVQYNTQNPIYNSKYSINEFTESQQSIRDYIDNQGDNFDQSEYLNYQNGSLNSSKKKRNNQISNTALRNTQSNTQLVSPQQNFRSNADDKSSKQLYDFRIAEGLGIKSYQGSSINSMAFKEDDENIFENNSLYSDKKSQNGLQQLLSLNASKKQQQAVVLPKIKQQIPISRNFYQGSNGNSGANINQKNDYSNLQGNQRSSSNGNQNYYSQQVNQNSQKNIFKSKDIEELNHLFQVESNKSGGFGLMYKDSSNSSMNYGSDVSSQNNYQQENNQNMKQNKQLSYAKKVEALENEIYELQTHITSRQKNFNQQLGISQFSELYATLRARIKNIQDLDQCNMKEIDNIINNCIKNCNSKTMSNIYSLLRTQIKLDRALQELDNLKNGHNN